MTAHSIVVWYRVKEACRRAQFIVSNVVPLQVVLEIMKQSEQTTGTKPVSSTTPWTVLLPTSRFLPVHLIADGNREGYVKRETWGVENRVFQLFHLLKVLWLLNSAMAPTVP